MKYVRSGEPQVFEAFLKSVQYLVGLQSQQDIWEHLGKFVLTHFPARWFAFVERDSGNNLSLGYCTLPGAAAAQYILTNEVRMLVADVLESGFLASRILLTPASSMTAFLPIVENGQASRAMLIGHADAQPIPKELLGIYLALAGLAGTTTERKRAEEEVRRLNAELEQRVAERTLQLQTTNDELLKEIVERKRVEDALRESREWLRVTLTSIGDAVIAADTDGRVTFLNPVATELTGWQPEEAEGQPVQSVFQIVNEQTRVPSENIVTRVLEEGHVVEMANHTALITKDGREIPIEDSAAPIRDRLGRISGVVLVFYDVTEKRRAQEEIKQRNAVLTGINTILEDALQCETEEALGNTCLRVAEQITGSKFGFIGEIGADGLLHNIANSNHGWELCATYDRTGYRPPENFKISGLYGQVLLDGKSLLTNTPAEPPVSVGTPAHHPALTAFLGVPLFDGIRVLGLVAMGNREGGYEKKELEALEALGPAIVQALHRKRAETGMRRAKHEWERTFDSVPDLIAILDSQHKVVRVNRAMAQRLNTTPAACVGLSCFESVHGTSQPPEFCPHTLTLRDGREHVTEVHADRLGGDFLVSATPLKDEQGRIMGTVHVARDISDRKRAEEALLRSEKLASVGRMASTIAHEINNPLAAVTNTLFLIRGIAELPESAREYLDIADAELRRVAHITRQTLGFYREFAAPAVVSVGAIIDSAIELMKNKIAARCTTVERLYDEHSQITAVAGELRQVFSNLLSNSLDAIVGNGTIKLRVSRLRYLHEGQSCLRVTVADNGSGIEAAALGHIFEPLFTTKIDVGTGLGLWVSKQIIEKHGGSIRVHSRASGPRRGTAFAVFLPAVTEHNPTFAASHAGDEKLSPLDGLRARTATASSND
jgi:PAS domain S-box-containing protein